MSIYYFYNKTIILKPRVEDMHLLGLHLPEAAYISGSSLLTELTRPSRTGINDLINSEGNKNFSKTD